MRAVNLIPTEQREGAAVGVGRSEGAAYAVMGLIAGLAILAVLYGMAKRQVESGTAQVASVTAQAQSAQAQASALAPYTTFVALREQREQDVNTLVESRFDWAHAFHEFGRVIPSNVSITSLTGTIAAGAKPAGSTAASTAAPGAAAAPAAAVSPSTPPGAVPTFTLSGCTVTQQDVALLLVQLRLMDGVSEVTLGNSSAGGASPSCGAKSDTFSLTVQFDPLPSTTEETTSATSVKPKTVADSAGAAASSSGNAQTPSPAQTSSTTSSSTPSSSAGSAPTTSTPTSSTPTSSTPAGSAPSTSAPSTSSTTTSSTGSSTPAATSGSVVR